MGRISAMVKQIWAALVAIAKALYAARGKPIGSVNVTQLSMAIWEARDAAAMEKVQAMDAAQEEADKQLVDSNLRDKEKEIDAYQAAQAAPAASEVAAAPASAPAVSEFRQWLNNPETSAPATPAPQQAAAPSVAPSPDIS